VVGLAAADPAGPCVPVLVKGIVLSVESGVIRRGPDSPCKLRCNLTRACYDSGPAEA
jgi:hypothetical protein